jgi:hypothetical protein
MALKPFSSGREASLYEEAHNTTGMALILRNPPASHASPAILNDGRSSRPGTAQSFLAGSPMTNEELTDDINTAVNTPV